jgi:hypothetical protein
VGNEKSRRWDAAVSAALVLVGAAASVLTVLPKPDGPSYAHEWTTALEPERAALVLAAVWRGCVPITDPGNYQFWNVNFLDGTPLEPALGAVLLVLGAVAVRRSRPALLFFLIGTAGLLAFTYMKWMGSVRHHGHLFLLFAACLWLMGRDRPVRVERSPQPARQRLVAGALLAFFAVQVLAALLAVLMDWRLPFSGSQEAAAILRAAHLEDAPIVGFPDIEAAAVAGHLDRPFFYPSWGHRALLFRCDNSWRNLGVLEVMTEARSMAGSIGREMVLVVNQPLPEPHDGFAVLGAAEVSIVPDEAFFIYLVQPPAARHNAGQEQKKGASQSPTRGILRTALEALAPPREPARKAGP